MKRNGDFQVKGKSAARIVADHLLTLFNLINFVLAGAIFLAGSYKNLLFVLTVLSNFAIGVFWELRAKYTLEKLRLVTQSHLEIWREGQWMRLPRQELRVGDRVRLSAGVGAVCDGPVLEGELRLDEASLTGEADPVPKAAGDTVWSGTTVLSGAGVMEAQTIGADCYAARITRQVKGDNAKKSVMMRSLNRIILLISIVIVPIGGLMLWRQWGVLGNWRQAVVTTSASLVGMIPDGLMLLTSTVLAIGVVQLARKKVLVQDLYSIESLARTDVICLDKTGTLTTGDMSVQELIGWEEGAQEALRAFLWASKDRGPTLEALRVHLPGEPLEAQRFLAFDSQRKYSALTVNGQSLILGAGDVVGGLSPAQQEQLRQLSAAGRVLVWYRGEFDPDLGTLTGELFPLGAAVLKDTLRQGIHQALDFFHRQGVTVKILSGDNLETVRSVAEACGVPGADRGVDCRALSDQALCRAAQTHTVFARVTPERKKLLVQALQAQGHTVAMTGDGINDVAAMRISDCAVAPAGATDGAKNVASLVMLSDDYTCLPHVVAQGRQSIGNVERSSSVFLTKTVFSALLTFVFLLWGLAYPFQPIQLTLVSTTAIGIPSFFLGLEPSRDRIRGNFLKNILRHALPGGAAGALGVCLLTLLSRAGLLAAGDFSGAAVGVTFALVYAVLLTVMRPLNTYRRVLAVGSPVLFLGGFFLLGELFAVGLTTLAGWGWMALTMAVSLGAWALLRRLTAPKKEERYD